MRTFTTAGVSEQTGVSLRQLDYWARTGALVPSIPARGQGTRRGYSAEDLKLARLLNEATPRSNHRGGRTHMVRHLRDLLTRAFRAQPDATFFAIIDGREIVACGSATEVVAAIASARFATVICAAE